MTKRKNGLVTQDRYLTASGQGHNPHPGISTVAQWARDPFTVLHEPIHRHVYSTLAR
jgi:hypothetical protein